MTIRLQDLSAALRKLRQGDLGTVVRPPMVEVAIDAQRRATDRVSGPVLNVRTNRLRSSIAGTVQDGSTGGMSMPEVVLAAGGRTGGDDVKYARIHELGGDIRPRKGQFLTIPVHPSLKTAAGVSRYASARMVPGLTYAKTLAGQSLLVHEETGEVYYILRRLVRVKARPYLQPSLREAAPELRPLILASLRRYLDTQTARG